MVLAWLNNVSGNNLLMKEKFFSCFLLELKVAELGTSLFEIAQSLFALERTLILGAMALHKTKSEA